MTPILPVIEMLWPIALRGVNASVSLKYKLCLCGPSFYECIQRYKTTQLQYL
jgi:hypothetical protein